MKSFIILVIALGIAYWYAYKHPNNTSEVFWGIIVGSIAGTAIQSAIGDIEKAAL